MGETHGEHTGGGRFVLYLILTAILCGALVMVIEVLGSRVIGPFFGSSLFVWTSLITVTLVALAAGYAAGGVVSDRHGSPSWLYAIILAAGVLTLLIPHLKSPVIRATVQLGLRSGALASSTLLFGPPLFFLGCVSPFIIKIAAREVRNIGKTVGLFYALSTLGSFVGTVCTGFVLIAHFGVDRIFQATGLLLIAVAAGYFALFRRRWLPLAFLFLPFVFAPPAGTKSVLMPNGTRATEVFSKDSFYGKLKVVDYMFGERHTREFLIDGLIQGGVDMKNGLSVYEYPYYLQFIPYALNPAGKSCLVIGLGAGVIPMWYERMGVRTDAVDIDPEVVTVARTYFGLSLSGEVIVEDARYFLNSSRKKYDYVIMDAFSGESTPSHLLSREALDLLRERMTERGILALNLSGSLKQKTYMTASMVKTLRQVFSTVEIYPTFDPAEGEGFGNVEVIAHNMAPIPFDPGKVKDFPVHDMAASLRTNLGKKFEFPPGTSAMVLSDDFNPIDVQNTWIKEEHRKEIISHTDWNILL